MIYAIIYSGIVILTYFTVLYIYMSAAGTDLDAGEIAILMFTALVWPASIPLMMAISALYFLHKWFTKIIKNRLKSN